MNYASRDIMLCGLFGAGGILLPVIFHLFHLGSLFMPMYLPLILLALYVSPKYAGLTAFFTPLLSGFFTGMPPFYPPIALIMAIELATIASMLAFLHMKRPQLNILIKLLPILVVGRMLNLALSYGAAYAMNLPENFIAGLSLVSGWPGILLISVALPATYLASKNNIFLQAHIAQQKG